MSLLEMKNIKKSFNGVEVLKDISLKVEKGEVLGIIGPSGSGKSTLLRCATGPLKLCLYAALKQWNNNFIYRCRPPRKFHYGIYCISCACDFFGNIFEQAICFFLVLGFCDRENVSKYLDDLILIFIRMVYQINDRR